MGEHSLSVSAAFLAMTSTAAASAFIATPSRVPKSFFHQPTELASLFDKADDNSFIPNDFVESILVNKDKSLRATLVRVIQLFVVLDTCSVLGSCFAHKRFPSLV